MAKDNKKPLLPELRFPEFHNAGAWDEKPLGKLSQIVRGGSPRPIDDFITTDANSLNWLKIADVDKNAKYVTHTKERVKVTALSKTREVNHDDLILSNSMSFGRPYILKIKSCIHDGWIAITKIHKHLNRDYLYYLILSPTSQTYFSDNAAGSGVKNLNADIIKLLTIPFPPLPEQQKIADCLSSVDELIEVEGGKLDALKEHKKALMQNLFPAEGKTTPNLRFPEFKGAGEWEEKKFGEIAEKKSSTLSANSIEGNRGDYALYGASGLLKYIDFYQEKNSYISIVKDGSGVGRVLLCKPFSSVLGTLDIIKPKSKNKLYFIYSLLQKINFLKYIAGGAIPHIYFKDYSKEGIRVPKNPKEQQKIADCLSSADDLITAQSQKIDALKEHKKGLMQQLFPAVEDVA